VSAGNGGLDNEEGDLIIQVGDILGDVSPHRFVSVIINFSQL